MNITKIKSIIKKLDLFFNEKVSITKIDSGVTNQVFTIFDGSIPTYIFRLYGNNLDSLIDRNYENKLIEYLNSNNIGPQIIINSKDYRIEKFIKGNTKIDPSQYQQKLGKKILELHQIPILNKNKCFWKRLDFWVRISDPPYQTEFNKLANYLKDEKQNLFLNEIVLGHGDLCLDNIIVKDEEINLIDFEYSCNLPRAFDLANHLCEYNGLISDENSYPEKKIREFLIKSYLDEIKEYQPQDLKLVDMYSLISHYQWGCWGIIMQQSTNKQFNYKKYEDYRFGLFKKYYSKFFN